jgi:DNA-binding SARP family transcriptional activator
MAAMAGAEVRVLGSLELRVDGRRVTFGAKQRALVATLALHANHVVPVASLIEAMWGDDGPDGAEHTLQQHVSAARKLLEPDRGTASSILSTRSPGYQLAVAALDSDEFERAASLGFAAAAAGQWPDATEAFDAALGGWRGPALADVRDTPRLSAAAVRLDEQRLAVSESRFEAQLECGRAREIVGEIEHAVAEHPLRERFRAQLMLALYRSGRQADALAAYQATRRVLVDELGIEPGAELRDLEQAILAQSPDLALDAARSVAELHATFRADTLPESGRIELPDGQSVLLREGVTSIGRDPSAHVRMIDNRVSRLHAHIETRGSVCVLRDTASTNGTHVNGTSIDEHELSDGDLISIGGLELWFRAADVQTS